MDNDGFIRSSFCNFGDCVEVKRSDSGIVKVRDSADPNTRLFFTSDEWSAFIAGVKNGEFD